MHLRKRAKVLKTHSQKTDCVLLVGGSGIKKSQPGAGVSTETGMLFLFRLTPNKLSFQPWLISLI